jgi:apolipoprotein N-acyltransferase
MPKLHGLKSTIVQAIVAGVLLWSAFPPLGLWPLGIFAVAIYIAIIANPSPMRRRDYWILWATSVAMWLALLQGIRLAYWPLYFGWLALSLYLGVYLVLTIGMARTLYHARHWPLSLSAVAAWLCWELVRGYFATGFSGCLLGHSVAKQTLLIQSACHFGAYAVSALVVIAGYLVFRIYAAVRFQSDARKASHIVDWVASFLIVLAYIGYGYRELRQSSVLDQTPLFTAALIQENAPTVFEANEERTVESWNRYLDQTSKAASRKRDIDLIVWPESTFTRLEPFFDWNKSSELPRQLVEENIDPLRLTEIVAVLRNENESKLKMLVEAVEESGATIAPYFLLGSDVHRIEGPRYDRLNAALWIDQTGKRLDYYAKQHLVMFGEYIPLGDWFPIIYKTIGMLPANAGTKSSGFELENRRLQTKSVLVPSVCFENMVPHLLHRQLREVAATGKTPDVMINITNDGWFHGSSISDIHLNNAIFAAVENRRPMLIAANVGITAWISGSGKIESIVERLQPATVIAQPIRDNRWGLWQTLGDWPVRILALVSIAVWLKPSRRGQAKSV